MQLIYCMTDTCKIKFWAHIATHLNSVFCKHLGK
uniref:Uncharacterized protein n=1 Tax=Anguilla anguilla TaxID=7936 RepID=A0A0E9VXW1_ANGAN